ncbi:MAG: hypothetical protein KIS68_12935 [Bauldia sp.]|nr:hypothetical protein [Bauldia sp.]
MAAAVLLAVPAPPFAIPAVAQDAGVPLPPPNPARLPALPEAELIGPTLDGFSAIAGGDLPLPGGDPALPLNFLPNPQPDGGGGPLNLVPNPGGPLDLLPLPNAATPPEAGPSVAAGPPVDFLLTATMVEGGTVIPSDIRWWIFGENPGRDGTLPLVREIEGGAVRVLLSPGFYLVQAVYGRATATTRIEVGPTSRDETIALNAGGLRLRAVIGDELPIPPADLRFEVLMAGENAGDRTVVTENAGPDQIIRLSAGPYQVISYYGETNAIVRADVTVTAGQLTDVTLYHQAARVTLKLVTSRGGEALANTAWSVVTEGGEIVFDSVGAFPTLVLATGNYTAIAKHGDDVFESPFTVGAGLNRDVEVLAENPVQAAVAP